MVWRGSHESICIYRDVSAADGLLVKLPLFAVRTPGDPHAFVSGNAGFREWVGELHNCAAAFLEQLPAQ